MYINFSLLFVFISIGFVAWVSGSKQFYMIAFWGAVLYAIANYSFGYVFLTAIELAIGGFIGWLVTGEKNLK